jgi:hypothetical protein
MAGDSGKVDHEFSPSTKETAIPRDFTVSEQAFMGD